MSEFKGKLHETVVKFPQTDIWNDSCALDELQYAIERGAVGATTNPTIVKNVLSKEYDMWKDRILDMALANPTASEEDIAWQVIDTFGAERSKLLLPTFEKFKGKKGRLSIQTNVKNYTNADKMLEQALHFDTLGPNMQVKMATSKAGVEAMEEATYRGVSINATISFTVPQAVAVAEAVERGLKRREAEGKPTDQMSPVCTIMIGRVDDWMKAIAAKRGTLVDPECLELAGVAVCKNAYRIYKERGYRTRLLLAAYRNHYHWSEFIGGDICMTIPYPFQRRINPSGVEVKDRINDPVDPAIIKQLRDYFPDFIRAYEPDGMKPEEFQRYGAFVETLHQFLQGYEDFVHIIRGIIVPDAFADCK